jgi:acetolactate synthase-1/2/3 large subunit
MFEGERPGGRTMGIQWWQEQRDQAGIVRNFTKWDYELRYNENVHHVVQRAFQVASAQPCGPVYLTLPREVLIQKVGGVKVLDTTRFAAPVTPQADLDRLAEAADILANARDPLIMAGYSGRNPASVGPLVELAETIGARVSAGSGRMNFPGNHPLCITGMNLREHLRKSDAVLIIDHDIPYMPATAKPGADASIIHIDIDAVKKDFVMWGFPVDILLEADSSKALPVLNELVRQRMSAGQKDRAHARHVELERQRARYEAESLELALKGANETPIALEWLCHCLSEVIDDDTIVVDEALGSGGGVARYIPRTKPGTLYGSGGSSLGFGLGASLGVKLASPDRTVACLVGDGSFIFGCPTPAFWASSVYHLPFLCVVLNNEGYSAVRMSLRETFGKDNYGERDGFSAGMDISPSPDYAMIARACGCYGETLTEPKEVKSALRRAIEQVRAGKTALLDARISRR